MDPSRRPRLGNASLCERTKPAASQRHCNGGQFPGVVVHAPLNLGACRRIRECHTVPLVSTPPFGYISYSLSDPYAREE